MGEKGEGRSLAAVMGRQELDKEGKIFPKD